MTATPIAGMEKFAALFQKRPDNLPGAIKPGLERIRLAYDHLGRPGQDVPTILVGGTNGKGSTAASLWQMLVLGGAKPGLYTSPHLVDFCERFTVAGVEIDDERIISVHARLKDDLGDIYADMSFFEVATLIAVRLFVEEKVSHFVLEVGLGGRWDATNIVEPTLSIISSIGRDHQAFLGSDLASIAREKAGIMRPGKVTLWSGAEGGAAEADAEIRAQAREKGAVLKVLGEEFGHFAAQDDAPAFLVTNRSLAKQAFQELQGLDHWMLVERRWPDRPRPLSLRGRFQFVAQGFAGRDVLVDVCHNAEGARAFADAYAAAYPGIRPTAFVTCSRDKDHAAIARELETTFSRLVFFPTTAERSWTSPPPDLGPGQLWAEDLQQAVEQYADPPHIIICGSVLGIGNLVARGMLALP